MESSLPIPKESRTSNVKLLLFFLSFLVIVDIVLAGLFFFLKGNKGKLPTLPLQKQQIIEVFSLPGWEREGVTIKSNSTIEIVGIRDSYMTVINNETYAIKVNGDFETSFAITTAASKQQQGTKGVGTICFYNRSSGQGDYFEVGIDDKDKLFVSFKDRKNRKVTDFLPETPAPSSGNLRVRFEGVKSQGAETVVLIDSNTAQELGRVKLPFPLFSSGNLYIGLRLVDSTSDLSGAAMTISGFRIEELKKGSLSLP